MKIMQSISISNRIIFKEKINPNEKAEVKSRHVKQSCNKK